MGKPRIVLFDIESLPDLNEVMKVFPGLSDYPGLTLKATINSVICFGYKIFEEGRVHCVNRWDFPGKDINNDKAVCQAAYEVLHDADFVVTHNGKRFDWKFLNTRFLYHGLQPLPQKIHIDTCQEAKKHLFMFNNRLNTLAKFLTETEKKDTGGWQLWVDVLAGKKSAMDKMSAYCKGDVEVLEKVFLKLRPLIQGIPNYKLFNNGKVCCPSCGSERIMKKGSKITKTARKQQYQCQECASWHSR